MMERQTYSIVKTRLPLLQQNVNTKHKEIYKPDSNRTKIPKET